MPKERILGLVDAENLYYTPKQRWGTKAKVDFQKLYRRIAGNNQNAKVIIYLVADPMIDQSKFIKKLADIGYIPRIKVLYSKGGRLANSNWDEQIIEDGIALLPETDRLVLVSGDGDFFGLVQKYKQSQKTVSVLCFENDFSPQLRSAHFVNFLDEKILMPPPRNRNRVDLPECRFPMQSFLYSQDAK